ncbi:MAG: hypothetical protein K9L62_15950 [Vallitaleaceae bacterium]|nr:hypothetical protein [Vallitaleaceae bacterium]
MEVINNTKEIIHLPYGNVTLQPGDNEVSKDKIELNRGHKGFENQLENSYVKIMSKEITTESVETKVNEIYPKRSGSSSWYELSTGEKVQGEEVAKELQKKIDEGELNG